MSLVFDPNGYFVTDNAGKQSYLVRLDHKKREALRWLVLDDEDNSPLAVAQCLNQYLVAFISEVISPVTLVIGFIIDGIVIEIINIAVSLILVSHLILNTYYGKVSTLEFMVSIFFIAAILAVAFLCFSNPWGLSLAAVIFSINKIATAINCAFLLQSVVVPTNTTSIDTSGWLTFIIACIRLIRSIVYDLAAPLFIQVSHWYTNIPVATTVKQLCLERDRALICNLLRHDLAEKEACDVTNLSTSAIECLCKDFAYDVLLTELCRQLEELKNQPMGRWSNARDIESLKTIITEFTKSSQIDNAREYIRNEIFSIMSDISLLQALKASILTFAKSMEYGYTYLPNQKYPIPATTAAKEQRLAAQFPGCVSIKRMDLTGGDQRLLRGKPH